MTTIVAIRRDWCRCPNGKPFARKTMHDDGSAQAPDFELDDGRTGYRKAFDALPASARLVRHSKGASERTAALDTSPMPVIGAGFDAYICAHCDSMGKDADTLPFLVPSRLDALSFRVKWTELQSLYAMYRLWRMVHVQTLEFRQQPNKVRTPQFDLKYN